MDLPNYIETLENLSYIEGIIRMVDVYHDTLPLRIMIQDPKMEEIVVKHFNFASGTEFLRAFQDSANFHTMLDDRFSGKAILFHTRKHRPDHILPNTHLCYCLRGGCVLRVGEDELYLRPGDTCIVRAGVEHAYYNLSETSMVLHVALTEAFVSKVLLPRLPQDYLYMGFFQDIVFQKNEGATHLFVSGSREEEMSYFLSAALYHDLYRPPMYQEVVDSFMVLFFTYLLQAVSNTPELMETAAASPEQVVRQLEAYIAANCRALTLRELAEKFHFNESYLSQYLKKNTGHTFTALLQSARISQAAKMLISTNLSVVEIADQVGYQNMSYFYRLFTEVNCCSPAEYRTRYLNSGRRVIGSETI